MNGRKTPAVAFVTHLLKTTSKSELRALLYDSPLKPQDIAIIMDYAAGMSYKELAQKYNKSVQRINQQKRNAYEQLHFYLVKKL